MTFRRLIILIVLVFSTQCALLPDSGNYYSKNEQSILEKTLNALDYGFGYDYQLKINYLEMPLLQEYFQKKHIRLFSCPIQCAQNLLEYDFIICGLPFNAFAIREVKKILDLLKKHAKPNCIFSYFEYIGVRNILAAVRSGQKGKQFRRLSAYLSRQISNYQTS